MMTKRAVGDVGEKIAVEYLRQKGYKIIDTNVVRDSVEADIVAKDGKTLVIVEVKTKHGLAYGLPQEMVGMHKQGQLRRFVHSWIAEHGECEIRIDVIAVMLTDPPRIEHLVNVVEG